MRYSYRELDGIDRKNRIHIYVAYDLFCDS